jgi:periplasmic protein TonB
MQTSYLHIAYHYFVMARVGAWLLSALTVSSLTTMLLILDSEDSHEQESVTIRQIDVALPPPPEPPPPLETPPQDIEPVTPSINLLGLGSGPSLSYADNPQLALQTLERVEQPAFNTKNIDMHRTISLDFPIFEITQLDRVPKLIATNSITFPREMTKRGITRVETKVEIIIDQYGKAFVKKIIDPVYPEMIPIIRKAMNDSKFTVPTKDGKPVQAVYLYSLHFINGLQ